MEPFEKSGPQGIVSGGYESPDPPSPNLAIDPTAPPAGEGRSQVRLSSDERQLLAIELKQILESHDQAMRDRVERWASINDAYNMVVDPETTGRSPHAQKLVSEMTRAHVNIATAHLVESIMTPDEFVDVKVYDDQASDQSLDEVVKEGEATESFLNNYFPNEMEASKWLPLAIHRATKLGGAVVRGGWETRGRKYFYLDRKSKRWQESETAKVGRVRFDRIRNEQMVLWPLYHEDISTIPICGHRSYYNAPALRALAGKLELGEEATDRLLARTSGEEDAASTRNLLRDLEGKDIKLSEAFRLNGETCITELWLTDYQLPGETEPGNYQLFMDEAASPADAILWVSPNPYRCQRHGYFLFPYWREDNSVWPSGVGHELLYHQKTDSALWNMLLDNLKVVGNVLRIVRANSMAESFQDQIQPGGVLVTDKVEEDFKTAELGGDLTQILAVIGLNEQRGQRTDSITNLEAGLGDPVLKSGASPGSIAQLRESSGRRFTQIDTNMRETISEIDYFVLELVQQYATRELLYTMVSEETADRVLRGKFRVPYGDIRNTYRIRPKAPSATSNKEVLHTRLMLTFQMLGAYLPLAVQLVDQVIAPSNPAMAQRFKEELMAFHHNEVVGALIKNQEIRGIGGKLPKLEARDSDQMLNDAIGVIHGLSQQIEQIQGFAAQGSGDPGLVPPS